MAHEIENPICNLQIFNAICSQAGSNEETPLGGNDSQAVAIVDVNREYKYKELLGDSLKLCHELETHGASGEVIALLIPNKYEYVVTQLGIWLANSTVLPLSLLHTKHDLEYFLKNAECKRIIISDEINRETMDFLDSFMTKDGSQLHVIHVEKVLPIQTPGTLEKRHIDLNTGALIIYTSGTTGSPKGVVLSHKNITAQLLSLNKAWGWSSADRMLHFLPLHHIHGIVAGLNSALFTGATVEMLPKFSVTAILDRILNKERNLTIMMGVPTMYKLLLLKLESSDPEVQEKAHEAFKQFRLNVSGSASLPVSVFEQWFKFTGQRMLERYGMSEIGFAITNDAKNPSMRIPGCVGVPAPGYAIRVMSEHDEDVTYQADSPGEVQVKGDCVFKEYYGLPEKTKEAFTEDGWFRTGDIGFRSESGIFSLMGRNNSDIIKSGGYKLSALEIERVLLENKSIQDVAVVGIPDDLFGQSVGAVVVFKPGHEHTTEDDLKKWCTDVLSSYKIPKRFVVVEKLPTNLMGKVDKKVAVALFGSG
ncbi:Acyl-CoA synthetase family member 3, mitochondrial [Zancudomyces culisetae]|uniref:Acyl-CoA synthetase family member 3, mitochondrial n=1 Tax=Zancudomyces culisetae TaxID=1213189 RepID=A0A1R1PMI8_ZANCU|nr:Acyl-CoA synthetase family member 3, mitochondrial [Zancudomyces culisetae]|eukprot:OMH82149.1 Acyl-CoA synthetase family member 3, mitochondrial [Zancudomyces culisetae]